MAFLYSSTCITDTCITDTCVTDTCVTNIQKPEVSNITNDIIEQHLPAFLPSNFPANE